MITSILANAVPEACRFIPLIPLIMVMMIYAFIFGLIIIGLLRLVKYLGTAGKEQKLIRMELGKLADEVQQIRQELKAGTEQEPLANKEGEQS